MFNLGITPFTADTTFLPFNKLASKPSKEFSTYMEGTAITIISDAATTFFTSSEN